MYLLANFGGQRSYGNGNINSYINPFMNSSEKAEISPSIRHIENFQNQEYQFTILKSWTGLPEKRKEEDNRKTLCVSNKRKD